MSIKANECWNEIYEWIFPTEPKFKTLTITYKTWIKLMTYCHLVGDYEVTGFGRVVDNRLIDVKILKQTIKPATVDCDTEAMAEFLMSIPKDQRGQWILDWHSHVKMGVFASGTDTTNYKEQWEARLKEQFPYIIVNQMGQVYARDYIRPSRETEISINIEHDTITKEELKEIYETCKADVESLCSYAVSYSYKKDYDYSEYDWSKYYGYNSKNSNNKLSTSHSGKSCTVKKNDITDGEKDYDSYAEPNVSEKQIQLSYDSSDYSTRYSGYDSDDFCCSCHTYLADADEYDRGLCDDCWDKMTVTEQYEYLRNTKNKEGYTL